MFEHRFREQLIQLQPSVAAVPTLIGTGGFVPCLMFHAFTAVQQTQIQAIYRIAAERTREQLRAKRSRRSRFPEFSRN
ncbi:hypothetical protein FTUN_8381 [Frigoriglobus tundricola]|uniref:Uncharacterized protein n=1 Tax=Frigoriglobus tundricola TaxID=2774151 RepID=A0A6M5Z3C4_9BACT|nr:hypothetical protein FTUN_8381 [Frigoriglobus tundricola]